MELLGYLLINKMELLENKLSVYKGLFMKHKCNKIENPIKYNLSKLMKVMNPNYVFTIGWYFME